MTSMVAPAAHILCAPQSSLISAGGGGLGVASCSTSGASSVHGGSGHLSRSNNSLSAVVVASRDLENFSISYSSQVGKSRTDSGRGGRRQHRTSREFEKSGMVAAGGGSVLAAHLAERSVRRGDVSRIGVFGVGRIERPITLSCLQFERRSVASSISKAAVRQKYANRGFEPNMNMRLIGCEIRGSFFSGDGFSWSCLRVKSQGVDNYDRSISRTGRLRKTCIVMAADFYSTLGVSKSASKQEIKSAYRKLARQYHPDVNKQAGAEDKFKEISNAYEILSDDEKRPLYDQFGEAGVKGGPGGQGAGAYATNPFDLFESFFGGGMGGMGGMGGTGFGTRRRSTSVQGDDIRYDMNLEFNEAIFGTEKEFEAVHLETCESCDGSGAKAGTSRRSCATCGGMGQVMRTQETPFGTFSQVSTCNTCGGEGEVISDFCRKCGGEGRVRLKKNMKVKIPAGVNSGSTLRVRAEGDAGPRGGPPGDLYVFLNVKEVNGIQRDGINLYSNVSVSFTDAILGTIAQVKTVDGGTELQIPSGTQPGDILVLSKMGVPKLNKPSNRGDHYFTVKVTIPTRLSDSERNLVEELANLQMTKSGARGSSPKLRSTSRPQPQPQPQWAQEGRKSSASEKKQSESTSVRKSQNEGVWGTLKNVAGLKGSSDARFNGTSVLQGSPSAVDGLQKRFYPSFLSIVVLSAVIVIASKAYPLAARLLSWMAARMAWFHPR